MYEIYVEKFQIIEWRYGQVWRTQSLGCGWYPEEQVKKNRSEDTGVTYVAATDEFARHNSTMRKVKSPRQFEKPENNTGRRQAPS
jgi:hypothetical protein